MQFKQREKVWRVYGNFLTEDKAKILLRKHITSCRTLVVDVNETNLLVDGNCQIVAQEIAKRLKDFTIKRSKKQKDLPKFSNLPNIPERLW